MPIALRTRAAWPRRLPAECVWPCRATQREKWFCRNLCIMLEKYFNGAEHRASLAVGCIESEMHSSVTRLVMNHGPHGRIGQED